MNSFYYYFLKTYHLNFSLISKEDNIIISGMPRGGTTWLAEILLNIHGTALLWEPLHHTVLRNSKYKDFSIKLGTLPYIPEDSDWKEAHVFFDKLLGGKIILKEYIFRNSLKYLDKEINLFRNKRWIIKSCRMNLLLPWITNNFDIKPPIFLIRHPLAVVASQLRHKAFNEIHPNTLIDNKLLYPSIYNQFSHIIENLKTNEEALAAFWCLNNISTIKHSNNNIKWITVSYERLINRSEEELKRILSRLNIPFDPFILENINSPSFTTKNGSPIKKGGNQLTGWKNSLKQDQVNRILKVVEAFGIEEYSDEVEPNYNKLYNLKNVRVLE